MDEKEIETWVRDKSKYHSRFLDLNHQLVAMVYILTAKVKKAKVIKLSEGESTLHGYYAEADFSIGNDICTLRIYSEPDGPVFFHNVYRLIGYENPPTDCYPEYGIFEGTLSDDLIKAFTKYARKKHV